MHALFGGQGVLVDPVRRVSGRVKGLQAQAEIAPAEEGLLSRAYLFGVKLIQLFKPCQADVALRQLDGLELSRVVHAKKEDLLSCAQKFRLQRAEAEAKLLPQPHDAGSPLKLGEHTGSQGCAHLAQHHAIAAGVLDQLKQKFNSQKAGLAAAPPAAFQQLRAAGAYCLPAFIKPRADQLRYPILQTLPPLRPHTLSLWESCHAFGVTERAA